MAWFQRATHQGDWTVYLIMLKVGQTEVEPGRAGRAIKTSNEHIFCDTARNPKSQPSKAWIVPDNALGEPKFNGWTCYQD